MPDWLSHVLIALILCGLINIDKKSLVVLGTLLPDIVIKLGLLGIFISLPVFFYDFVSVFHTPIVVFLLSIIIAPIFRYNRLRTLILINFGSVQHFLADLTMKHFEGGIPLLFPFSSKLYSLNLIWPEESLFVLVWVFVIYLIILVHKRVFGKDVLKN